MKTVSYTIRSDAGLLATFFPWCYLCCLASDMNENPCGACYCGSLFAIPMRTKVRAMYGIRVRMVRVTLNRALTPILCMVVQRASAESQWFISSTCGHS